MKKLLILLLPITVYGQNQSNQFMVEGDLVLAGKDQKVYLEYTSYSHQKIINHFDSASMTGGKFSFAGKIHEPSKATIYCYLFGPGLKSSLVFFLASGKTTVTATTILELATVGGTAEADEFVELKRMGKKYDKKKLNLADSLIAYSSNHDKGGIALIGSEYKVLQSEIIDSVYIPFILRHLSSAVGVYALKQITESNITDPERMEKLFSQLSPIAKKLQSAIQLEKELERSKRTAVGTQALDFTMLDTKGKPISLSSFRGKYVLVDFWASWCRPCREEAPNLINVLAKYKNKGFTILGVALEMKGDREKWLRAIAQDGLFWTQLTDFKYWDNSVVKQYFVTSIPFNFLVDPQGKIIARDIQGAELEDTLSKLFK